VATDSPYGRRDFLKDSVVSVAKAAQEFAKHQAVVPEQPAPPPMRTDWLRPPGAADEALFLERCTQCGDCAKVCPYGSITFHPQNGTPVIFADQMPCYLCAELPCIAACSTKALLPIADPTKVRMGLAVVSRDDCTAGQGCQSCVARCPVEALSIVECDDPYLVVEQGKCVGCGICEETCSTVNDQIAITVISGRTSKDSPHSDPRPAARPT